MVRDHSSQATTTQPCAPAAVLRQPLAIRAIMADVNDAVQAISSDIVSSSTLK